MCVTLGKGAAPDKIGRKSATLWRLHNRGIAVPDGFIVPAGSDPDDGQLWEAVLALVERSGCTSLAVRSSGDSEDGNELSLAGLFESVLEVALDLSAVRNAIERCRTSGRSDRARAVMGGEARQAVLIQEMVQPTWSGLLFTRDPRKEHTAPMIELVRGHLRSLVDGAEPDLRASLDPKGRADIKSIIGYDNLIEIEAVGRAAENALGGPADIEWAATEKGVVLLQARPITGLASSTNPSVEQGIELVPVTRAHAERMPQAVKQHDKVGLRLLADELQIPISRGALALCLSPRDFQVAELAGALGGWGEIIAVMLKPFTWQGRILRHIFTGETALEGLQRFLSELDSFQGWFAFLLKELQPTARTGIAVRLPDGRVRAEIIVGHFASKGIADATSYLLTPEGKPISVRRGRQTSTAVINRGRVQKIPIEASAELSTGEMRQLCEIMRRLSAHHPEASIEVGYTPEGELFLIDLYESPFMAPPSSEHEVICEGRLIGRVRWMDLDENAVEASIERHIHNTRPDTYSKPDEPEILLVHRPYHLLDQLVYSAAPGLLGMVFEEGSLLCHLAVVMREKGVPGLLLPGARSRVKNGDRALLDTRPGSRPRLMKL